FEEPQYIQFDTAESFQEFLDANMNDGRYIIPPNLFVQSENGCYHFASLQFYTADGARNAALQDINNRIVNAVNGETVLNIHASDLPFRVNDIEPEGGCKDDRDQTDAIGNVLKSMNVALEGTGFEGKHVG